MFPARISLLLVLQFYVIYFFVYLFLYLFSFFFLFFFFFLLIPQSFIGLFIVVVLLTSLKEIMS